MVTALCTGSQERKQELKDILASLVYADSEHQYKRCKLLLLNRLDDRKDHPLYKYFIKKWDGITDEWVSYLRTDVPHLGNHTNNRIEAKWAKLKDLIRPSASVDVCIATLIGLQGI
ncbi:hypothetical protein PHYSODRAFT_525812 [Phytophthora sojae]|uniref:Uncharacterized protein n=1 Tax=Phytophthora sojae (strain P6497) TaxID=1094619 RepID=G5A6S8_PHYSP|nr:hypothetical protein PHYSODRAFT_525812 [Phytophthora sojae]EGZ09033.1 hypothetical protein PHYSODRAFT_525812 [Phytophthora sojae]|eukprot:XP_009535666.1 hypothetical protein PHYSODRAFT_525812 [Phytophthora sojae]